MTVNLTAGELRKYWLARAAQHTHDSYAEDGCGGLPRAPDLELYGMSCHPSGFLQRRERS